MPFTGKSGKFNAAIRTVEIGTGDKAVKLGGENVMPLYSFDAPIENAPKIGVLITDLGMENEVAGITDYYAGASSSAEIATKAEEMPGADFVVLRFEGADPNGEDRSLEVCVAIAKQLGIAITTPLVIAGC